METIDEEGCELCERERPLTFHHLIPVSMHRKTWCQRLYSRAEMARGVMVCRDCHDAIHRFIPEKDLGREWNTVDRLREHPDLARFVGWVSRQDGRFRTRGARS